LVVSLRWCVHIGLTCNRGDPLPSAIIGNPPTHILAADCVYFEPAFPLLLATLSALLSLNPSAIIYFCFKRRRRADMQFMKKARKLFVVQEVEDEEKSVWERDRLFLYVFRCRSTSI
jgi:protein N-lysine methyltransferase METTL21A